MKRVTVVGAGTMGHGIAHVAALAGYETSLTDAKSETLEPALAKVKDNLTEGVKRGKHSEEVAREAAARITLVPDLASAVRDADLVIEAIVENLEVKGFLFNKLERWAPRDAVLATNTSSLSITAIAAATSSPQRVIGMHFFNPVHVMKLVEIIIHPTVSDDTVARAKAAAAAFGKEPIVAKDTPGFASSRLGVVLGLEAMRMVEQGVASATDIDKAMELGYAHVMGPLKVSDLVGLDVRLAIAEYLYQQLKDAQYAPPEILKQKVKAGELGKKTGKGFHEWPKKPS